MQQNKKKFHFIRITDIFFFQEKICIDDDQLSAGSNFEKYRGCKLDQQPSSLVLRLFNQALRLWQKIKTTS